MSEKINDGYYIKARKIQESWIAHSSPCTRETWDLLLLRCNHKYHKGIDRGQCRISLKEIQNELSWYVGYRKMTYSKAQCEDAMKRLRKHSMITTTKTTRGMIVTVLKYDFYQNPENYEANNEKSTKPTTSQQTADTIYKNDKNERIKEKKKNNIAKEIFDYWNGLFHDTHLEIKKLTDARKRKINTRTEESSFDYKEIFQKVVDSKFLTDPNKEWKGFCFDWVIANDHNYIKILEGKYNDKE